MNEKKQGLNSFGRKGWGIIIYVGILYLISSATVDLINVIPDTFNAVYGWDTNQMLVFSSVGGYVGVVLSLAIGRWVTHKGVKVPTIVMLFLMGIAFFLTGQVGSIAMYGAAIAILAAAGATVNLVSTNAFMSNWFPKKKGVALGWATMGAPVSSAVSIPIFMIAFNASGGKIASPFIVFAVISIIVAVITIICVKGTPEEAGTYPDNDPSEAGMVNINEYKSKWSVGKLLTCGQTWVVSLVFGFLFIALVATMTQFIPRMMAAGFTQEEGTAWLSIAALLGIVGSYIWGVLDQKFGTKKIVIVFAAYMAIMQFALAATLHSNRTLSLVLTVFLGILIGGICNLFPSMVITIFGRYEFAAANSVVTPIVSLIRTATFILMAGVLAATMGDFAKLSIVLGVISVIALVLSFFLSSKEIPAPGEN